MGKKGIEGVGVGGEGIEGAWKGNPSLLLCTST